MNNRFMANDGDFVLTDRPRVMIPELEVPAGWGADTIDGTHKVLTKRLPDETLMVQKYHLTGGRWEKDGEAETWNEDTFYEWLDDQI